MIKNPNDEIHEDEQEEQARKNALAGILKSLGDVTALTNALVNLAIGFSPEQKQETNPSPPDKLTN